MVKYAGGALIPPIPVDRTETISVTAQLASGLRDFILSGRLAPGERLPSSRTFAKDQGVSRTTAVTVYEQLMAEELIYARVGSGAYVSETLEQERPIQVQPVAEAVDTTPPRLASLSIDASEQYFPRLSHPQVPRPFVTGLSANDEFPMGLWARLSAQYWRQSRHLVLGYPDPVGLFELRRAISYHLKANRGVICDPDDVFIFNGAQDAFNRIGQMLLNPGDKVWFENPGPIGARNSLVSSGARLVPVPVDDQGIDVAAGLKICPEFRMAFVTPARQHPLGMTMSLGRRLDLLNAAGRCGAWIIEDDYDGEFYYSGHPAPTLKSVDTTGRVIYVGTFSKVMFAALRLGYVVAPPGLAKIFRRIAGATMQGAPSSLQSIMARFMEEGHFNAHLRRMRRVYAERHAALIGAAAQHLDGLLDIEPTTTGFQTVGRLHGGLDERAVATRALERGIIVSPLSRFSLEPARQKGLILGFSAVSARVTEAAIRDFGNLLRTMRDEQ